MNMKKIILTAAIAIVASFAAKAQQKGIHRTDLQQHDLSIAGREAVQVRVDIEPGVTAVNHNHPGEEIVYVLEGALEYTLAGRPPVILKAGEVLFIPYGTAHVVKNVGNVVAKELATYVVEKGKPLITVVK